MDPVTIYLLIALGVVWFPKTGEYLARVKHFGYDSYNKYLRSVIDRLSGERPPTIHVAKLGGPENTFEFEFTNIEITRTDGSKKKYKVHLTVQNKEITLAEIDFSNWKDHKEIFKITIEKTSPLAAGENATLDPKTDASEYDQVIETLGKIPLFLGNNNLLPDDSPTDIRPAWDKTGFAPVDWSIEKFQDIIDKIAGQVTGKPIVRVQLVDPVAGSNPHLADREFIDKLIGVVAKTGDDSLLINYFKIIENSLQHELEFAKREIRERETAVAESAKKVRNAKIILAVSVGLAVLAVAGLVALFFFAPPSVLAAVAAGYGFFQSIVSALKSATGFIGALKIATIGGIIVGAGKVKIQYDAHNKLLEEKHLDDARKAKKFLEASLADIKTKKEPALKTLEAIKPLTEGKIDTLELRQQKVGNLEIKIISKYLGAGKLSFCTKLFLSNNQITVSGLEDLASVLKTQNGFNIKEIDLRGNDIGVDGVGKLSDVLQVNFSLTDVQYDQQYPEYALNPEGESVPTKKFLPVDRDVQIKIARQLMINRYLRGEDFESFDLKARNILFPGGKEEIDKMAQKKVWENFEVTNINFDIRKELEIDAILRQNQFFSKLLATPADSANPEVFRDAYQRNPERCAIWLAQRGERVKKAQQEAIIADPMILKKYPLEYRKGILTLLFPNIPPPSCEMLANIIENFPEKTIEPFATMIKNTFREILSTRPEQKRITEILLTLNTKITEEKYKKTKEFPYQEFHTQQTKLLAALNKVSKLQSEEDFAEIQRFNTLTHITTEEINSNTVDNFFTTFKKMNPLTLTYNPATKKIWEPKSSISLDSLLKIIRFDIYADGDVKKAVTFSRLKTLDPPHRLALLEFCFKDEADGIQKANLISLMLAENGMFDAEGTVIPEYSRYLSYIVSWNVLQGAYTYNGFKEKLKEDLQAEKRKTKDQRDPAKIEMLDRLLQKALQFELVTKYKCLQSVHEEGFGDFEDLQKELQENLDLRGFDPKAIKDLPAVQKHYPTIKMRQEAVEFTQHIARRNQLYDALGYNDDTKLAKFIDLYRSIADDQERQNCLKDFLKISQEMRTTLPTIIKNDIYYAEPKCKLLKTLQINQRTELLEACLKIAFPGQEFTARGIATLVSGLIDIRDKLNNVETPLSDKDEYIWRIFDWQLSSHWPFNQYIASVKTLKDKVSQDPKSQSLSGEIEAALQAALQADLESRFECLREKTTSDLEKLKIELENNYNLRKWNHPETLHPDVKKTINAIILRNNLLDAIHTKILSFANAEEKEKSSKFKEIIAVFKDFITGLKGQQDLAQTLHNFLESNKDLAGNKDLDQIKNFIERNPQRILDLATLDGVEIVILFETLNIDKLGLKDTNNNAILLATVLKNLPADIDTNKFRSVIAALHSLFRNLGQKSNDFYKALEEQRGSLINSSEKSDQKDKIIKALDLALFAKELGKDYDSVAAKQFRLLKLVQDYPLSADTLGSFVTLYQTSPIELDLAQIDQSKLRELIKTDDTKNKFPRLRSLNELGRIKLLTFCLKPDEHALGIATLASKLIGFESPLVTDKHVWAIFDWATHTHWTFDDYISELVELRNHNPSIASDIDQIIQKGLQEDLKARFGCLNGQQKQLSFNQLKNELKNDYRLTDFKIFEFPENDDEVRTYVKSICWRNLLKKYVAEKNLKNFIETLRDVPQDKREEILKNITPIEILSMITADLGTTKTALNVDNLKNLDEGSFIMLLKPCFVIGESGADTETQAYKKASLLYKMLHIENLLSPMVQQKILQEINTHFYWAISTEGGAFGKRKSIPYYTYTELTTKLGETLSKVSKQDPTLGSIREALEKAIGTADQLKIPQYEPPKPSLANA